jgi:hypothetical protein
MFAPTQLLCTWHELRPTQQDDFDLGETGGVLNGLDPYFEMWDVIIVGLLFK